MMTRIDVSAGMTVPAMIRLHRSRIKTQSVMMMDCVLCYYFVLFILLQLNATYFDTQDKRKNNDVWLNMIFSDYPVVHKAQCHNSKGV